MNQINLSDVVMVSDPCYTEPTWCQIKLKDVLPGTYTTTCRKTEDPSWGNRCSILVAVHEDYIGTELSWREHGEIGVDSGQAGIFSYDTYRKDGLVMDTPTKTYSGDEFFLPNKDEGDDWYEKMCKFTLTMEAWGSYDNGVVSSSGIGDGGYKCLVARKDKKIVGIAIDYFMEKFPNKFINTLV